MTGEDIRVTLDMEAIGIKLNNAQDLIQLVIETLEDDFLRYAENNARKARAAIGISALYVLSDYLRGVCRGIEAADDPQEKDTCGQAGAMLK